MRAGEKIYKVATDIYFPPFEYEDKDGKLKGIDIELLKALAEDQNFKYELLPLGFQASMEALDNEEVDAIFSGMSISEARKEIDGVIFVEYNIANGLKVKMPLGEEDYSECAVMVKKGKNKEFIEVINRGLSNLKKNGKYEEIINKYLN
ncbi:transporter substrate-binding domain-containing protein [Fusobacterium mortiferum]|uniref:transporter substrate-binding domain-containing protein n=1 Tax=Fusobacterium mortiferum TaxID=850 RepID=UPI002E2088FC